VFPKGTPDKVVREWLRDWWRAGKYDAKSSPGPYSGGQFKSTGRIIERVTWEGYGDIDEALQKERDRDRQIVLLCLKSQVLNIEIRGNRQQLTVWSKQEQEELAAGAQKRRLKVAKDRAKMIDEFEQNLRAVYNFDTGFLQAKRRLIECIEGETGWSRYSSRITSVSDYNAGTEPSAEELFRLLTHGALLYAQSISGWQRGLGFVPWWDSYQLADSPEAKARAEALLRGRFAELLAGRRMWYLNPQLRRAADDGFACATMILKNRPLPHSNFMHSGLLEGSEKVAKRGALELFGLFLGPDAKQAAQVMLKIGKDLDDGENWEALRKGIGLIATETDKAIRGILQGVDPCDSK
jgi:hypothetical protein